MTAVATDPELSFALARDVTLDVIDRLDLRRVRVDLQPPFVQARGSTDMRKVIRYRPHVPLSTVIHELAHLTSLDGDHGPAWQAEVIRLAPVVSESLRDMMRGAGQGTPLTSPVDG